MSLMDEVMQQLQGGGLEAISKQVGVDTGQVSKVVQGALPAILGGLAKNSATPEGLGALAGALDRDHDGGVLNDVMGFLGGGGGGSMGAGILRHVLGSRQAPVEKALGQSAGLGSGQVGQILAMLAPLVMGALGKAKKSRGLDTSGLGALLGQEKSDAEKKAPDMMGMLGGLLDSDGDGNVMDDVAKMGSGLLGGLFGGK